MTLSAQRYIDELPAADRAVLEEIVQDNFLTLTRRDGVTRRGQHPKGLGCVRAVFTVRGDIPEWHRIGLFAKPGRYEALIRFSNGAKADDNKPDAHGMAIKLLDVPGKKLLPGQEDSRTHDFILADNEAFFSVGLAQYRDFNHNYARLLHFINTRKGFLGAAAGLFNLGVRHLPLLLRAKRFAKQTPASPLKTHYWSATPYLLGERPVKYMAQCRQPLSQAGVTTPDGLSSALVDELADGPASFDFGVHVQIDPKRQPDDDPTVRWSENGAPFVRLGRIDIPQQDVIPHSPFEQNLVYSIWNVLPEHRPIGPVNLIRLKVYMEMSKRRQEENDVRPAGSVDVTLPAADEKP